MIAALTLAGCQGTGETQEETPAPAPTTEPAVDPTEDADEPTDTDQPTDTEDPDEPTDTDQPTGTQEPTETGEATEETTEGTSQDATEDDDLDSAQLPGWTGSEHGTEQPMAQDAMDPGQEITEVRVAAQDGFDRVVLELTGDEVSLGWLGSYQDEATESGSGAPIDVDGEAVLLVPVVGIDWTAESEQRYDGETVVGADTVTVTEVVFGALFEGEQQVFVGVQERSPYRIFALQDPARIVIDVQHP